MKRKICFSILIGLITLSMATGCRRSDTADTPADPPQTSATSQSETLPSSEATSETEGASGTDAETVDIDLTLMPATMVYAEVYDMMYEPEKYIGKTVKMDGIFSVFHNDTTGQNYFSCVIQDATACCAQGMEFILEDAVYPGDYPKRDTQITVIGTFDTYMEHDRRYCHLKDAAWIRAK